MQAGIKGMLTKKVESHESAKLMGSGLLDVYATPCLVAFVEKTCWFSISDYLEEGQTTVGTKMEIAHLKATPLGMEVSCTSELVEVDRKRLVFSFEVWDEIDLISKGVHERFIVEADKFQKVTDEKSK